MLESRSKNKRGVRDLRIGNRDLGIGNRDLGISNRDLGIRKDGSLVLEPRGIITPWEVLERERDVNEG